MLAAVIHLIFHLRRRGAGTPGVNKGICLVIAYLSQKLHQLLEVLLGFPRKAYNQVCSQAGLRHSRPDFPHQLPIALHRIYPVHGLENPVAAVLHRQMEMLADMAAVLDDLNHLIAQILGMGGHIANPFYALHLVHHSQKLRKAGLAVVLAVGVHILPKQGNLPEALGCRFLYLFHDILRQAAPLPAPYIRYDAVGAEIVAAVHDGNPG